MLTSIFAILLAVIPAILLLFFAVGIPMINNAIALKIEGQLKKIPLPQETEIIESTSVAGKILGNGNGMHLTVIHGQIHRFRQRITRGIECGSRCCRVLRSDRLVCDNCGHIGTVDSLRRRR